MNPHDWSSSIQRLHSSLEAHRLRDVGSSENVPWREAELHHERLCCPNIQPSISSKSDWKEPSLPIQNCKELEPGCPDGEPMVLDMEDPELLRRKKELQEIEERIMYKRAFIAVKTIGLLEKKSSVDIGQGETLKDRVKAILQRHPDSLFHKIQQPKERLKSPLLSEGDSLDEQHPLKLRVKSLMKQRHCQPAVLPASREKISSAPLPSSNCGVTSPAKGASRSDEAFERFLKLLNKNTNVNFNDMMSSDPPPFPGRIHVSPADNHISERCDRSARSLTSAVDSTILYEQVPALQALPKQSSSSMMEESKVEKGFERFLSVLNKGVDINLLSKIVMDNKSLPESAEPQKDKMLCSVDSNNPAVSPLEERKKMKLEDKETPHSEEAYKQLQDICRTLKLNMAKKMSKEADCTLGGKTENGQKSDGRETSEDKMRPNCSKPLALSPDLSVTEGQTELACRSQNQNVVNTRSRCLSVVDIKPQKLKPVNTRPTFLNVVCHSVQSKNAKRRKRRKKKKKGGQKTNKGGKTELKPLSLASVTTKSNASQKATTNPLPKAPLPNASLPNASLPKALSVVTSSAQTALAIQNALTKRLTEPKPKPLLLTEDDIKANLRKRLQEFNEKAKQARQVYHPPLPDDSLELT